MFEVGSHGVVVKAGIARNSGIQLVFKDDICMVEHKQPSKI